MTTTGHPAVHDPGPVRRVAARRQVPRPGGHADPGQRQDHAGPCQRRGIGEPVYPGRSPAEVAGCQVHEALLNAAFDAAAPFWLPCPFDLEALAADMIDEAHRTRPFRTPDGLAR